MTALLRYRFILAGVMLIFAAASVSAQPKVLTPGKLKITELEPSDDLNGKIFAPPLENNQGMIQITLDPAVLKYFTHEDVQRWFRESRITIDQLVFDRNLVTARRDGDVTLRFTYSFLPGQSDVSRRVQIRREASDGVFASYFQSHRFYNQRVTRLVIGINEEPVLEQEAKGIVVINAGGVKDFEVEAIGPDGVPRKFFESRFELPVGAFMVSVSKSGFETTRQRINITAGATVQLDVTLKPTATARVATQEASGGAFKEQALNRLKFSRTVTARRPVLGGRFNPDGSGLATWHADNLIYLWDLEKGQPSSVLTGHGSEILDLQFFPEKELVFSVSEGVVVLHNYKTGKAVASVTSREIARSGIRAAAFVAEAQLFIVVGKDLSQKVWSIAQRKEIAQIENLSVNKFVPFPDNRSNAALMPDGTIRIRPEMSTTVYPVTAEGNLMNGFTTQDGKFLVVGSEDVVFINNTVSIVNLGNGQPQLIGSVKASAPLAFFQNQFLIAADNANRTLSVFDVSAQKQLYSARNILLGEKMTALSPDGKTLVTSGTGNDIIVYDLSLLEEWAFLMETSRSYEENLEAAGKIAFVRQRLKKPLNAFRNAQAMRTYDDKVIATVTDISKEAEAALANLRNAQLDFLRMAETQGRNLEPQTSIETRADYEKRMEISLSAIAKSKASFQETAMTAAVALEQAHLKSVIFELTNESSGLPRALIKEIPGGRYGLQLGSLTTEINLSQRNVEAIKMALQKPGSIVISQSDVTVNPVRHSLQLKIDEEVLPIGPPGLQLLLAPDQLYTNLFTIDLKASGTVQFFLSDAKSMITATAIKDGVSFTKQYQGNKTPMEFRPGTYNVQIGSTKFKTIEQWTITVEPGTSQVVVLPQFTAKQQTAQIVFKGDMAPYTVNLIGAGNKTTAYTIWAASQMLEVAKGNYAITFSKPGYTVTGRNTLSLIPGMRETLNLTFTPAGQSVVAVKGDAPPEIVEPPALKTPAPSPSPASKQEVTHKKGGGGKWLLFLAAAGGGGYFLYSELNKGGASPLPTPPGRPN